MATDSKIFENVSTVVGLNLVGGKENTPLQEPVREMNSLILLFGGVTVGSSDLDRHFGLTRVARNYQVGKWAGRRVRNENQVSIATDTDLEEIAEELDLVERIRKIGKTTAQFMSQAMAVNLVIDGTDTADLLGAGTKLFIGNPNKGAIVDISGAHLPCSKPAVPLSRELGVDHEDMKDRFKTVAEERRGFMASVYSEGPITIGDSIDMQLAIDHRTTIPFWD